MRQQKNWLYMLIREPNCFSKFHRFSWKSTSSFISTSELFKSKILGKLDQKWSCNSSALLGWRATKFGQPAVFGWLNLFLACCNFSFGLIFLKFWILDFEVVIKIHADFQVNLWDFQKQLGLLTIISLGRTSPILDSHNAC